MNLIYLIKILLQLNQLDFYKIKLTVLIIKLIYKNKKRNHKMFKDQSLTNFIKTVNLKVIYY